MSAPFGQMDTKAGSYRTVLTASSVRAMSRRKARKGGEPRADARDVVQPKAKPPSLGNVPSVTTRDDHAKK
jgi:hypothetical protein